MNPVSFHPNEKVLTLPDDTDVMGLPVLPVQLPEGHVGMMSCWQPSEEDRQRIAEGKPIYLLLWFNVHPPVSLFTENIFAEENQMVKGSADGDKKDSA